MKNILFTRQSFAAIVLLISIFYGCSKSDSNEPKKQTVYIYLVASKSSNDQGRMFGCNDILVPIEKNVLVERSALESALNTLIETKNTEELQNFVKGPGLLLYQVTIADGKADVYLKGDFAIYDVCDIPRIHEQIFETAKQFPEIKTVKIFMNNQTLEYYLSVAKEGFL